MSHVYQIPTYAYNSEKIFVRECQSIFQRQAIIVGHRDQVAESGDFMLCQYLGHSIIIVRDQEQQLQAFYNICPHRGARLINKNSGSQLRQFRCPYHDWRFDLRGNCLQALPGGTSDQRYSSNGCGFDLRRVIVYEEFGLIWLSLNARTKMKRKMQKRKVPNLPRILRKEWHKFRLAKYKLHTKLELRQAVNWKLIVDASLEAYHFNTVHQSSIASYFIAQPVQMQCAKRVIRMLLTKKQNANSKPTKRNVVSADLRKSASLLYFIFPNAFLLFERGVYSLLLLFPETIRRTKLRIMHLVPAQHKRYIATPKIAAQIQLLSAVFQEDMRLVRKVQENISTAALPKFQVSRQLEPGIIYFHRLLKRNLHKNRPWFF